MKEIHKNKLVLIILIAGFLSLTLYQKTVFNNHEIDSNEKKITSNRGKEEYDVGEIPKTSQSISWEIIPNVNNKYFSPDTTPGKGDEVLYSFSVDQPVNYTLNISSYYRIIENYPSPIAMGDSLDSSAYLMSNGTWLVITTFMNIEGFMEGSINMFLGIGTNISNFKWSNLGKINTTETMAVCGDESGKIRIVYAEVNNSKPDGEEFQRIRYLSSDNWGHTWKNGTLKDYTQFNGRRIYGLSMASFQG